MSIRTEMVARVIHRELSQFFAEVIDEKEYGLVTITRVTVFPDLSEARIYISVMENAEDFLRIVQKRSMYIRHRIRPRLTFQKLPKFVFVLDTGGEYMEHISELLNN